MKTNVLTIAARRRDAQVTLARATAAAARAAWARVDRYAIGRSWRRLLGEPLARLVVAQLQAAHTADAYVAEALDAQGVTAAEEGSVWARSLAGVASDGRSLDALLYQPAIEALTLIGAGATPDRALSTGALSLDMIVRTQVADAGRVATGIGIAARPGIGYTRVLTPPSCSRCAILSGTFYQWSRGFQRHPRCDCVHVPATRDSSGDLITDPRGYFDSLTDAEQNRIFTIAGAAAIRDGANMSQVVNARRGMQTAGQSRTRVNSQGLVVNERHRTRVGTGTTEATRRRGGAPRGRLMPEEIYRRARSREEAIALLRQHRYLI